MFRSNRVALTLAALAVVGLASALAMNAIDSHRTVAAEGSRIAPPPLGLEHAESLSGAFKFAAQSIRPAVVQI
ncbi:MAG: hypothetical protein KDA41_00745, partial [Planctomycetales bacterium]|nr:hypothetical protein [Planctomycetales bacterium]